MSSKYVLKHQGVAGTVESSDVQIIIDQNAGAGIEIELNSSVINQYGKRILEVLHETLQEMGVENARLQVNDKGALDCTIKARTEAAVMRAADIEKDYDWEAISAWKD